MQKNLVITLTGPDQVGLVERFTKLVLDYQGNIEASRMARLGGVFAILMHVSVPEEQFDAFRERVRGLREEGYKLTTSRSEEWDANQYAGWMPYQIELTGADHEGILHGVARHLAERGINIETLETNMVQAPMSGIPLFMMDAIVLAPPTITLHDCQERLDEIGDRLNVEINVTPYTG
ncbi:MAG TPA: transcriptional regulator [Caldilineae bacterium]|nr:transcriptional regulator [Caldilineae bacterium]